jgi:hypothetical protein
MMGWFKAGECGCGSGTSRRVGVWFGDDALRRSCRVSGLSPARNNLVPEGGQKRLSIYRETGKQVGRREPRARAIHAKARPVAARPNSDFLTWFILTAARSPTLREAAVVALRVLANRLRSRSKKARSGLVFSPPTLSPRIVRRRRSSRSCPALTSSSPASANCRARQSSRPSQTSSGSGGGPGTATIRESLRGQQRAPEHSLKCRDDDRPITTD